jgi:4-diphosphocytidyl-2-C-methyl-D-erythritol kinase
MPSQSLKSLISLPLEQWKNNIKNDFEENLFVQFPNLQKIKHELYQKGAIYAQMSGSGSAIFGIFDSLPNLNFKNCDEIKTFIL